MVGLINDQPLLILTTENHLSSCPCWLCFICRPTYIHMPSYNHTSYTYIYIYEVSDAARDRYDKFTSTFSANFGCSLKHREKFIGKYLPINCLLIDLSYWTHYLRNHIPTALIHRKCSSFDLKLPWNASTKNEILEMPGMKCQCLWLLAILHIMYMQYMKVYMFDINSPMSNV